MENTWRHYIYTHYTAWHQHIL